MTTGVGTTLTMGYDGLRRLTSVTGGPVSRQYTYRDIDSTKTTLQVASVTSGGQQYGYTYDSMGNIATYSAPGKGTITYTYDNQGQLLKAAGDTTYTYTYDGAGNILTASDGTTTHTYTYGDADWKDLLTGYDRRAITYDSIGNPTSYYNGNNWDFTWANGRSLTTASGRVYNLSFTYDANGLRTSKTDDGIVYRYYYAGEKLIRMTWGANIVDLFYDVNGTPYAMKRNGFVYYYITNLQGDVMKLVDASGNVVASYEYDPYGKILSSTGSLATVNPLRYRGYVYDQETGFYYLQSRYYDPAVGRFINADGYASTGQGIIGYNMFAYCGNSPLSRVDSEGTFWGALIISAVVISALLSGCSGTKENAPEGYIQNNRRTQNCYSYAFGLRGATNPGVMSAPSNNPFDCIGGCIVQEPYSVDEVAEYVLRDMKFLGIPARLIDDPSQKNESEYIVAMKTSSIILPDCPCNDFHFAVLLSNGMWADKQGDDPSRWGKIDGYAITWDWYPGDKFYDSETRYFAVGKS